MADRELDDGPVAADHRVADAADAATEDATDRHGAAPLRRRQVSAWVLVPIGIALGAVIGLGLGALRDDGDDAPRVTLAPVESPYPADQVADAEALLVAWDRYRNATFRAEVDVERVLPGGEALSTQRIVLQQPPRRAVRERGGVSVIDDDSTLVCDSLGGAEPDDSAEPAAPAEAVCTEQATDADYAATVTFEIAAWRTAIGGDQPAYAVTRTEPGCFELQLVRTLDAPPYGRASRLCFDEATGVLRSRETVRDTATDRETIVDLRPTVTEADWESIGAR